MSRDLILSALEKSRDGLEFSALRKLIQWQDSDARLEGYLMALRKEGTVRLSRGRWSLVKDMDKTPEPEPVLRERSRRRTKRQMTQIRAARGEAPKIGNIDAKIEFLKQLSKALTRTASDCNLLLEDYQALKQWQEGKK